MGLLKMLYHHAVLLIQPFLKLLFLFRGFSIEFMVLPYENIYFLLETTDLFLFLRQMGAGIYALQVLRHKGILDSLYFFLLELKRAFKSSKFFSSRVFFNAGFHLGIIDIYLYLMMQWLLVKFEVLVVVLNDLDISLKTILYSFMIYLGAV